VSRFGEQGDRVGDIAAYGFDHRKAAKDQQREKQATLACVLGVVMVTVVMGATMPMVVVVVPVIAGTVTLRVVVIVSVLM
jgi:uncharacterized protein YqhQ